MKCLIVLLFYLFFNPIRSSKFNRQNFGENDHPIVCPRAKANETWFMAVMDDFDLDELLTNNLMPATFIKPNSTKHYNCPRIFAKDKDYIKNLKKNLITYKDNYSIPNDCISIQQRNHFPTLPNTHEEADYPIAYARIIYKDYYFLEMELAAEYAPQNFYCYVIDKKADKNFKKYMHNLETCFPNVFVSENYFDINSGGKNMNYAYLECMQILSKYEWNYVVLLQNHDVILKTNYEMVQIFQLFCGANDIRVTMPKMSRFNESMDWTFKGLELVDNNYENRTDGKLVFAKGKAQNSLSRNMVDFMLNELNLTKLLAQLEGRYGIDELLMAMLQATDALNVPGGFTKMCMDKGIGVADITRNQYWRNDNSSNNCLSKIWRHDICIIGLEDLPRLKQLPHITINKMMPQYDFGAITCWFEYMFNRSHIDPLRSVRINPMYYLTLPHVRYHYEKLRTNGHVNLKNFDCTFR